MKTTSQGLRVPVPGTAVAIAICAAFGVGPAAASEIIVPINTLLGSYNLDVNHDGTPEYTFTRNSSPFGFENDLNTYGNQVVGVVVPGGPKPGTYAQLLHSGELIDGSQSFVGGPSVILSGNFFGSTYGDFYNNSGFAGLRFSLPGESGVHYGWAELNDSGGDLTLVAFGYETDQDVGVTTPSVAPEPGTLALLAAGAVGVVAMRRRKKAARSE
jgi:hypothetical protein